MIITLKDAYKIVGGSVLFEAINFELKAQEKIGLVGRNGSGKSTLFRLLTQEEALDGGDLFIKKGVTIGYLEQIPSEWEGNARSFLESSFQHVLAMIEEMRDLEAAMQDPERMERALSRYGQLQEAFMQAGGFEMEADIDRVASGLGLMHLLEEPFAQLSGGEKTKLGLAKVLLSSPDVLLLDEPTNHLDLEAIEWLEQYIAQYEGAVCIISHDRSFLDQAVSAIADLENGDITKFKGGFTSYEKQKEEKLLAEFKDYQEQQKKIKKIKEAIRRLRQWANEATPPNPKLFKKAKSMERALEKMEKVERPVLDPKKMNLKLEAEERSGTDVVVLDQVSKTFGDRRILNKVDLHVRYQESLAIVGPNGSGKTTLIKILLGEEQPDHGEVKRGSSVTLGYLSQTPLKEADTDTRMIDYFREHIRVTEPQARHILAQFMFFGYTVFQKLSQLSGGERMRVKLAIFMHQGVNVLVLDEPTNHLDIESQEVLEEALGRFSGTVIGVSHDRYFLNQCFNETAYLVEGLLHRYPGTFSETKDKWERVLADRQLAQDTKKTQQSPVNEQRSNETEQEALVIDEQQAEHEIGQLETQIEEVENLMQATDALDELMKWQKEKDRLNDELEALYAKWVEE
ncbi:ribosomal protection-like ABC-F family protein [Thalassobacillus sp. CUG 92003]|uniref:ribosomal protection-like ABC-F family protein n=1 Tax=Thalassobacillus sp. CUG 92003 TaxID=2736641 RepID=UPI00210516A7|nr:ABC-F family ATP-binding cassette domain-containing protein [Thalassobacillus sp. CUG 92003]